MNASPIQNPSLKNRSASRRRLTVAIALFLLSSVGFSAEADFSSRWQSATAAYQGKNYPEAARIYEDLLSEVPRGKRAPADLYYNLGNVYYKQGQPGLAAWMYEKVLAETPRHSDARGNLKLIRAAAAVSRNDAFLLFKPLWWISSRLTAGEWAACFTFSYLLAGLFAALWILRPKPGRLRRACATATILSVSAAALFAAFLLPRYIQAEHRRYAVVVETGAIVRNEPGADAEKYFEAVESERLEVSDAPLTGWLRVKRPADGLIGFLPESVLREI